MSLIDTDSLLEALKSTRQSQMLVQEKLQQWTWFERFLALNPDVEERWKKHKTYEILKDEHIQR